MEVKGYKRQKEELTVKKVKCFHAVRTDKDKAAAPTSL